MKLFDKIAEGVATIVARAPFFGLCALFVGLWSLGLVHSGWRTSDLYHLILNSPTTAITFLLVALFQNTTKRHEDALHKKLDAVCEKLGIEDAAGIEEETSA